MSLEGLAFVQHLERSAPTMKRRIVAIDFNPEMLERLEAHGDLILREGSPSALARARRAQAFELFKR